MKLKMSEKSLFAILLRSPWWVSLLIVGVFALAARAVLPAEYVAVGALGGLPFLVIGMIAAWRQWRAPKPALMQAALERAAAMSWRDFSAAMSEAFERQGYSVSRLDGGAADFKLEKQGQLSLVSCRRWKAVNHGFDSLRELGAARDAQRAQHASYITLGPLNDKARRQADAMDIRLIHGHNLAVLLTQVH